MISYSRDEQIPHAMNNDENPDEITAAYILIALVKKLE